MGRRTGSSHVDFRSKTRYKYTPIGLVISRITPKNNKIWNHPLPVMARISPVSAARRASSRKEEWKLRSEEYSPAWSQPSISAARSPSSTKCRGRKTVSCTAQKSHQSCMAPGPHTSLRKRSKKTVSGALRNRKYTPPGLSHPASCARLPLRTPHA
jgi:hypothetical protein